MSDLTFHGKTSFSKRKMGSENTRSRYKNRPIIKNIENHGYNICQSFCFLLNQVVTNFEGKRLRFAVARPISTESLGLDPLTVGCVFVSPVCYHEMSTPLPFRKNNNPK